MAPKIYFIPRTGISPEVIEKDIQKYLGLSAMVQSYLKHNDLPCYIYISPSRPLSLDEIKKRRQSSVRFELGKSFRKLGAVTITPQAIASGEIQQTIEIWSAVLNKYVTTVAKLDRGSIRKDANLVTQGFLKSIKMPFRPCRQHDWVGFGGRLQIVGEVNLKIFPISFDRKNGRQQKGRPKILKFGVFMSREAPFGDMLLGEEYIKERPTFMWGHKLDPNKTPVQQLQHMAEMQRLDQWQRQIQGRRSEGSRHVTTNRPNNAPIGHVNPYTTASVKQEPSCIIM